MLILRHWRVALCATMLTAVPSFAQQISGTPVDDKD